MTEAERLRELSDEIRRYEQICLAETDDYNRANDEAFSVQGARASGLGILTYANMDAYFDYLRPERIQRRARRRTQAKTRSIFMALPLSERIRFQAMSELGGALRVHARNMSELEA